MAGKNDVKIAKIQAKTQRALNRQKTVQKAVKAISETWKNRKTVGSKAVSEAYEHAKSVVSPNKKGKYGVLKRYALRKEAKRFLRERARTPEMKAALQFANRTVAPLAISRASNIAMGGVGSLMNNVTNNQTNTEGAGGSDDDKDKNDPDIIGQK